MNKTAIKNFAIWARNKLIADIIYQASLLGISEKGIASALPQSTNEVQFFDIGTKDYMTVRGRAVRQRDALVKAIRTKEAESGFADAFRFVVEKVAYTWFNRLIAIRFMEVNDYLPGRIRVLSSENPGKAEPDIVTRPYDSDLDFTTQERDEIARMKDENRLDELFRMLFVRQCHKLHEVLPDLFDDAGLERADNYLELLLTISFTDKDGVLWHLIHDIPEDDFNVEKEGQVEIIGWMYQYYNTEPKDRVFANLKKNIKIDKDSIPAATQLFTPDWIVRYMVENSLGRLWVEGHLNERLKENWKYYLEEAEQEPEVQAQLAEIRKGYAALRPEDIRCIDPCMGSGHILVYLFDVLMQIYESQGWTQREAAQSIVRNNLYGLDIDDRAAQLAYFAVMMKARQYDSRWLTRQSRNPVQLNVFSLQPSGEWAPFERRMRHAFARHQQLFEDAAVRVAQRLFETFADAKEYGSIIQPDLTLDELDLLGNALDEMMRQTDLMDLAEQADAMSLMEALLPLIRQARALVQKYHVVVTNPPYMGASGMSPKLSSYTKLFYPNAKADLYSCFIERNFEWLMPTGVLSMITMETWMFLASFEALRWDIGQKGTILNMVHMPYLGRGGTSLGINFGTSAYVIENRRYNNYKAQYEYTVYYECDENGTPFVFPTINSRWKTAKQEDFALIPGMPFAYWVPDFSLFNSDKLGNHIDARIGMVSGDNNRFLRLWHEVSFERIEWNATPGCDPMQKKWYPLQKGGEYRHWYGNQSYVVNWEHDGYELKYDNYEGSRVRSHNYNGCQQFKGGITWNSITTSKFHCRYSPAGFTYDAAGPLCEVTDTPKLYYILGFLTSKVAEYLFALINPTVNFPSGYLESLPYKERDVDTVTALAQECLSISKREWDSREESWSFMKHPLITGLPLLSSAFCQWNEECEANFSVIKSNEEELNRIFIDIYGLQDEMTPEVEDKDVTVRKADLGRDIRSLISYAVGCMLGRYSLDMDGLAFAGGEWDATKYTTYQPDSDNCLPITDEDYGLQDDIVERFVDFIRAAYGPDTLEENLDFIAKALGNKGNTSREIIRNYFLNDFYKDHVRIYQKRPIYWLFDSGKQNGFKALVYMHRWNADTVGNMRVEYLHRMQRVYEKEIDRMQDIIDNSHVSRDVSQASKRREKLVKQLKEARDYDAKVAHVALSRVEIDLDDGVKVNYEKVQAGPDGKSLGILAKL